MVNLFNVDGVSLYSKYLLSEYSCILFVHSRNPEKRLFDFVN